MRALVEGRAWGLVGSSLAGVKRGRRLGERKKQRGVVTMKHRPRGGFVSGGFGEKKGLSLNLSTYFSNHHTCAILQTQKL